MKWLLLGACFVASTASAAPCGVSTFDPDAVRGNAPRTLDASDAACPKAVRLLGHFNRMARVLGMRPGQDIHFQIKMTGELNAYYLRNYDAVSITVAMLRRHSDDELTLVLAHEMGHAKQSQDGARGSELQLEGHADALAAQILLRAGYPADLGQRGVEGWQFCGRIAAPNQGQPTDHPVAAARWQNVVAMTAAHMTMRDGLSAANAFDGRGRTVPWAPVSVVGSDGVARPGALVRRTLSVRVEPRLGGLEAEMRGPGQAVPRDRVVVSDVPIPFAGGQRMTITRRILNAAQVQGARDFNRAVSAAATRIESYTGVGPTAMNLTARFCGRPLDYRSLTALLRDASAATARRLQR